MDAYTTHGAFSWNELTTSDPAAAAAFYGGLFGWTVEAKPMGPMTYHVVSVAGEQIAGIMQPPPEAPPMLPAWGSYVTVEAVDQTLAKCLELGGKVIVPAMDVPGVGRMAVIQDPQGALLNVMTYAAPAAA